MREIQNGDGHVGLTARAYPVAGNTELHRGQTVKLSGGLVTICDEDETDALLGIAAETHLGAADVLNPRADGSEVYVYDSPLLVFECPAPVFAAASGTATTITAEDGEIASTSSGAFTHGRVKLKRKGVGSGNTDCAGSIRKITGYAVSEDGDAVFTVESGGTAGEGDCFYLFPPLFSAGALALTEDCQRLTAAETGCTAVKVVGWDFERNMLRLMASSHELD